MLCCRCEQLSDPFNEGELLGGLPAREKDPDPGLAEFYTVVQTGSGLFGRDPEYWKTVHLGGPGRDKVGGGKVQRRPESGEGRRGGMTQGPLCPELCPPLS